ncbi:MAG: alpha/beta fold hydrolase [Aureispira sp.]
MKKIGNSIGIGCFLVGLLAIFFEEPLYGVGIFALGFLIFNPSFNLLSKQLEQVFRPNIRMGLILGLGGLIIGGLWLQGRTEYEVKEDLSPMAISKLSIHPIKQKKIGELDYFFIEKGSGPAVFLLHGFPDMANTWDETITALSKKHRVIAPFLRGYYPTSIAPDGDYSVKTIAEDIIELANQLGIEEFNIMGQDWGASISSAVANIAPDKVLKVITLAIPHPSCVEISPELLYYGRHFIVFDFPDWSVRYTRKNNFEYIDRLYKRWSPDFKNYKESSNAIKETFKCKGRLEAALGYYWSLSKDQKDQEMVAFYKQLPTMPFLFLGGENDAIVTPEMLQKIKDTMPTTTKTIVFKKAGHFLHQEVFEEYIKEVKAFLAA